MVLKARQGNLSFLIFKETQKNKKKTQKNNKNS